MTSVYDSNGNNIAVTVIEAGPNVVTQVKSSDTDGYNALQLCFSEAKEKNVSKAMKGHFAKANTAPKTKVCEFAHFERALNLGDSLDVSGFEVGEFVDVIGTSKGKGFQGVVKRHGFAGVGGATHVLGGGGGGQTLSPRDRYSMQSPL